MKDKLNECIELYREVFGDSRKLTQQVFFNENNLVDFEYDEVDNKIVSVAFARKKTLRVGDQIFDIPFMFGIATHKDYRHQGRSSKVINALLEKLKNSGYPFTMLCPANDGLYDFYAQFGFKKFNKVFKTKIGYLLKEDSQFVKVEKDEQIQECLDLFNKHNDNFIIAQIRDFNSMKNRIKEIVIDDGSVFLLQKESCYGYIVINGENKIEEIISLYSNKNLNKQSLFNININTEIFIQDGESFAKEKEVLKILNETKLKPLILTKNIKIAFYEEW